jgi:hypothetical protein
MGDCRCTRILLVPTPVKILSPLSAMGPWPDVVLVPTLAADTLQNPLSGLDARPRLS